MALNFLRSSQKSTLSPEAKELLNSYMAGAKKEIGFVSKSKAEEKSVLYAMDFYHSGKAEGLTKSDVKIMEKQVNKELKQYGVQEHINYAATLRAKEENPLPALLKDAGIGLLAASTAASAAADGQYGIALGVVGVGVIAAATKAAIVYAGLPNTEEQSKKVDEYTELKHAQLALKQLKREFKAAERAEYKKEVSQLFAAGYGQPSGGFVQAAMLKRQKAGR